MKLVEILARDLKVWPDRTKIIVQDADGECWPSNLATDPFYSGVTWTSDVSAAETFRVEIAHDNATAIVTRADWEAERAKLKAPKANGNGWLRHRGGKCPVEAGVLVDVRHRDGDIFEAAPALKHPHAAEDWSHTGVGADIMAYRIHKPAEQPDEHDLTRVPKPAPVNLPEGYGQVVTATLDSVSGPLEWRDRIRELDAQRAEVESTYQRQISEITQERESLVQKLAGEGLSLIGDKPGALLTWQRYAKDGMKINAIKEYRELTGAGLREAKEAVEAYQDSLD